MSDWAVDTEVSSNMARHVQSVCDYITQRLRPNDREYLEEKVVLPGVGYGTVDYGAIFGIKKSGKCDLMEIVDLKYGKGKEIFADAIQTPYYALGLMHTEKLKPKRIKCCIYQPRLKGIECKEYTYKEILEAHEYLKDRRSKVKEMDRHFENPATHHLLEFQPGSHCDFCRAKEDCKALAGWLDKFGPMETEHFVQSVSMPTAAAKERYAKEIVGLMNEEELGQYFLWCDMATRVASAVKEKATSVAAAGLPIKGLKLVKGRSNRKWLDEDKAAASMIATGVSEKDMYTRKLISPAQAEKITNVNQHLIVKPKPKPVLVHESDKRPELNPNEGATDGFGEVETKDRKDLI